MSLNSDDSDGSSTNNRSVQYEGFEEPNESFNDSEQTQTTTSKGQLQQQQQLCRREKNRISKLKSRARKRELINSLQAKVTQLNAAHNELRVENEQLRQEFERCTNELRHQGRTGLGQNVLHDTNQHAELLERYHNQAQRQGGLINQTYQPTASVSQVALRNHLSLISTSTVLPNMVLPWSGNQHGVPRNNNGTLNIGGISQSQLLFGKPKDSMFDGTNNKRRRF